MTAGGHHRTHVRDCRDAQVVDPYDDWFQTPYGRFVGQVEGELLLQLLSPLDDGATVLDIGCGTGWFGSWMRDRGFQVTGVDPSGPMLARSSSLIPVVQGDALRLPFADRAFDAAYLIAVLDFVSDPSAVLSEARRIARGRVAVLALASGSWLGLRRRISARRGHPVFSHAGFYSRRRLLQMARATGAEPQRVRGALFLPPSLAPNAPRLERWLGLRCRLGAGVVGFSLPPVER